jgi:predicted permease
VQALLQVILPVFLVIGAGYLAVRLKAFPEAGADALMKFTQNFAIPCLLFAAIARLDLGAALHPALLFSFYAGATSGFVVGLLGARILFGRAWEDSVAIGFACLFSNSVLLGLPITERAYGAEALQANFAIIAFHAPFCYALGITVMEVVRNRGGSAREVSAKLSRAIFSNALVIGIGLGFLVNLTEAPVPGVVNDALDMLIRAALPTALFGLGGVLVRYRLEGDLRVVGLVCGVSLLLHPAIVLTLGKAMGLPVEALRSAVVTAAMPPGVNAFIFAALYGVAMRVAASAVLIATALSVVTAWGWLQLLP